MPYLKKHNFIFLSLIYIWVFEPVSTYLLIQEWYRLFYLTTLFFGISLVWGLLYTGEMIYQTLVNMGGMKRFFSGMNWVIAEIFGIAIMGNIAIIATVFAIANPLTYKSFFSLVVLISTLKVDPHRLTQPIRRIIYTYSKQTKWKWLWLIPILSFGFRYLSVALPINGTEQLHNTLPFAKYIFRGVDFNDYNLDNHFLLLGIYETFGVFLRAFTLNDFAYHIIAQQVTFLLIIGGMVLLLGTIPWILRKLPLFGIALLTWPTMLNFATTDTISFKPDWIGVLSAAIATIAIYRQGSSSNKKIQRRCSLSVIIFSAIAVSCKLAAIPYVLFLLVASFGLSIFQNKKIQRFHIMLPLLFFLLCAPFFGKNTLWLGNPLFPGFQSVFSKPERLSDTTTFNTYGINKETKNIPNFIDYLRGYLRFWQHHPEFIISMILFIHLLWKKRITQSILVTLGLFLMYITLMSFYFYPSIYERFVAYAYINLLVLTVFIFLEYSNLNEPKKMSWAIGAFFLLMLTHAHTEVNIKNSWIAWGQGISPKAYRIQEDPLDQIYFEINKRCHDVGRLHNFKWRNYFYADFDTVNYEDLMGSHALLDPKFYNKYNINFVISRSDGHQYARLTEDPHSWFFKNFSVVYRSGNTILWQRHQFNNCTPAFSLNQ